MNSQREAFEHIRKIAWDGVGASSHAEADTSLVLIHGYATRLLDTQATEQGVGEAEFIGWAGFHTQLDQYVFRSGSEKPAPSRFVEWFPVYTHPPKPTECYTKQDCKEEFKRGFDDGWSYGRFMLEVDQAAEPTGGGVKCRGLIAVEGEKAELFYNSGQIKDLPDGYHDIYTHAVIPEKKIDSDEPCPYCGPNAEPPECEHKGFVGAYQDGWNDCIAALLATQQPPEQDPTL